MQRLGSVRAESLQGQATIDKCNLDMQRNVRLDHNGDLIKRW